MGNEKSALRGLEIEDKAIEVTDYWMHYDAYVHDSSLQRLSIFISEPSLHFAATFGRPSPLERAAKNFMLHRHPCILKYISSWSKGSKFFLATEEARPLVQVIEKQNILQICIGLHSILRALIFLHETALASHNNVCSSSIYVTAEGYWKLGGLECLCKFADASPTYYQRIKNYRYEKAISSNEDIADLVKTSNLTAIDSYAFGVLAEDILKNLKDTDEAPNLLEFSEFCKKNLQNSDAYLRNSLLNVLQHSFFTHEFIRIHAFLEELPLKTDVEREEFFTKLRQQLQMYPEAVVAEQLGRVLLSRIVLLDSTAQVKLLPFIFKPKDEKNDLGTSLFTIPTFKTILVPRLLQMFCIRDVSIRLLLLSHFSSFVHIFEADELKNHILPELLVGIKDTNDDLVCATLRALADIVPILGAAAVIGGNRGKLFTDGRPNKKMIRNKNLDDIRKALTFTQEMPVFVNVDENNVHLSERPSPDGGEDKKEKEFSFAEEEYIWSDWETQDSVGNGHCDVEEASSNNVQTEIQAPCDTDSSSPLSDLPSSSEKSKYTKKLVLNDITELDIKNSKVIKSSKEEFDFFTDMEPVIQKTQILHVPEVQSPKSMFDVKTSGATLEEHDVNGWGEDLSDLSLDDTYELAKQ
ncbi:Protein-associating with the carboxyl-terminal domain of ezrin [Atta colombica]|uniref:Protein-associating with the carboxyl-terminal domain of ezrin n=1 Tax=Atta colombica TaxID=520822 RepID=A0A195BYI6_9HYME|nr:PREDICTED: protein-associating with the carboxyl-terminal domain of ezrin [Atta colombica]KYM93001.1 Protein-associating with the carboxyl-terminal domain of ezrin [Atta colombica]